MKRILTIAAAALLPCLAAAQEAEAPAGPQNLNRIRIHVIGLDADPATQAQLQEIAQAGGGTYHDASDEAGLVSALGSALGIPTPTMMGAEQEGNNGFGEANGVATTGQVAGAIDPKGDEDWYSIEVDRQGLLRVLLTNVPAELDLHFRVFDANYRLLHNWVAPLRAGADTQADLGLPGPGRYAILVVDGKNDAASPNPYTLQLAFHPGDGNESNNSFGQATRLAPDGSTFGSILPQGDEDWYAVDVPRAGTLHVALTNVPPELDLHLRVYDAEYSLLRNWIAPMRAGADNISEIGLPRGGTYTLQVVDGKGDAYAVGEYTLTTRFDPADRWEPNPTRGTATPIKPTAQLFASINPLGDVDGYRFDTPHPGVVNLAITNVPADLELQFRVYDANHRLHRNWVNPLRAGAENLAVLDLPTAGRWYLAIQDSGGDAWSPDPYTLQLEFVAADSFEPNGDLGSARPIALGQAVQASILPKGDNDWFAFDVAASGTIEVSLTDVPEEIDLHFRVLRADGKLVHNWVAPLRAGSENVAEINIKEPGRYVVEVSDGKDDARAEGTYTLRIQ